MTRDNSNKFVAIISILALIIALSGSITSFKLSHTTCVRFEESSARIYVTLDNSVKQLKSIENGTASPRVPGYEYYSNHPQELTEAISRSERERDQYKPENCRVFGGPF